MLPLIKFDASEKFIRRVEQDGRDYERMVDQIPRALPGVGFDLGWRL